MNPDVPVNPLIPRLAADGTLIARLVIPGRPATKKNSQRIVRRRILPSKAYLAYESHCQPYVEALAAKLGAPIDYGVSVTLTVYQPDWKWLPDHVGLLQSLGDVLQKWGVVKDDLWIVWHQDGHWLGGIDKAEPRVELTIRRQTHPKEDRK